MISHMPFVSQVVSTVAVQYHAQVEVGVIQMELRMWVLVKNAPHKSSSHGQLIPAAVEPVFVNDQS